MTDIALLGFAVNAAPLETAKTKAREAAQSIGALGDAADKTSGKLSKTAKDAGDTGKSTEKMARDMLLAVDAIGKFSRGLDGAHKSANDASVGLKRLLEQAAAASPAMQAAAGSIGGLAGSIGGVGGSALGGGLVGGLGAAARGLGGFVAGMGPVAVVAGTATAGLLLLAGAYYKAAESLATYQDRQTQNEARLKNALGAGSDPAGTVAALQSMANEAGIAADSTIDAFARIARNGEALGASTNELLQLSETIQKLGIVSNASAGEISAGQLQLSQALASGKLNGDELRSVMENLPALAKAIADGLGVSVGQLRAMGAAGELTGDKVFRALLSQTDDVREEFKSLPDTTERAFTRLENQANRFKARLGEIIGASETMQAVINAAANAFERLNGTAPTTIDGITARIDALVGEKLKSREGGVGNFLSGSGAFDIDNLTGNAKRDAEIADLQKQLLALRAREASTKTTDAAKAATAELARALGVAKDVDDAGTRKTKIIAEQKTMTDGLALAKKTMAEAAAEAAKYAGQVSNLNGAIAFQLARTANPLDPNTSAVAMFAADGLRRQRTEAQKRADEAAAKAEDARKAAEQITASLVVNGRSLDAANRADPVAQRREEVASLERQAAGQLALARATGAGRTAARELEIAQAATEYRIKNFAGKTTPEAIAATNAYAEATRRLKVAQESVADARAFRAIKDSISNTKEQAAEVINGEYAVRLLAAQQQARQADLETPGMGRLKMAEFDANEQLTVARQLQDFRKNEEATQARIAVIGDAAAERRLALEQAIKVERDKAAPGQRDAVEAALRQQDATKRTEQEARANDAVVQRLALLSDERGLVQYTGRELAIQTALLQKRKQLEAEGAEIASDYYDFQLKTAGVIAGQMFDQDLLKGRMADLRGTVETGLTAFREAGAGVFSDMFRNGTTSADAFFERLNNGIGNFIDRLVNSLILNPLFDAISNPGGTGLIDSFINGLTGSLTGAFSGGGGSYSNGAFGFAKGGAFLGGHEVALAGGGVLHGPKMFGLAGGRTGVAGEAGAEGVLPLRRSANGRLGVESSGGGGGTVVQIIDQRTSAGAEPVEVRERQSADGQRMIYLTVRDQVKSAMRSGDMDADMRGQYNVGRPVIQR